MKNANIQLTFANVMKYGFIAGIIISITSYAFLYFMINVFPSIFIDYLNPMFNSDGSRDLYYYLHGFVLGISLAIFWLGFRRTGNRGFFINGIEFALMYACVALIPVLWVTYSAMDVTFTMILSWLIYGTTQAFIGAMVFTALDTKKH
ncbi:MAG: hypothetical protein R2766_00085 [Saprospiraceae bacterium]